jgi:hypothetical protein
VLGGERSEMSAHPASGVFYAPSRARLRAHTTIGGAACSPFCGSRLIRKRRPRRGLALERILTIFARCGRPWFSVPPPPVEEKAGGLARGLIGIATPTRPQTRDAPA